MFLMPFDNKVERKVGERHCVLPAYLCKLYFHALATFATTLILIKLFKINCEQVMNAKTAVRHKLEARER